MRVHPLLAGAISLDQLQIISVLPADPPHPWCD